MDTNITLALEIIRLGKDHVPQELYTLAVSVLKKELNRAEK